MKLPDPEMYFGKTLRILDADGGITEGDFLGFNYDYDDNGKMFLEFDVDSASDIGISFTEDEIESIVIL